MAEAKIPKPAPVSRYGPSFDEIERRDPVQWHTAHKAWMLERVVEQEMLKVYRDRMKLCYMKEQENFPQVCRKQIMDYWNSFQAWKKKALVAIVNCDIKEEDDVLLLTGDNWNEAVTSDVNILVQFYSRWSVKCKTFAPGYAKVAKTMKEKNPKIKIAKVNASKEKKLAKTFNIEEYPTIIYFRRGTQVRYEGGLLSPEYITDWVIHNYNPAIKYIKFEKLNAYLEARDVSIVGFFTGKESALERAYIGVTEVLDYMEFAVTTPSAVADEEIKKEKIVIYRRNDGLHLEYSGIADTAEIKNFVSLESVGFLTEVKGDEPPDIYRGEIKSHLLTFVSRKSEHFKPITELLTEAGKKFRGKVVFTYADVDIEANSNILQYYDMQAVDAPRTVLFKVDDDEEMIRFRPEEMEFTKYNIFSYVQKYIDGGVKRALKTSMLQDGWDRQPVKELVGKNFVEVALSKEKNVFVEFYSVYSKKCQQLGPIWKKLGDRYNDSSDVVIASMDVTANEVEGLEIETYPTIKYYPKQGAVVDYNGKRSLDDFVAFIESGGKVQSPEIEKDEGSDDDVFSQSIRNLIPEEEAFGDVVTNDKDMENEGAGPLNYKEGAGPLNYKEGAGPLNYKEGASPLNYKDRENEGAGPLKDEL